MLPPAAIQPDSHRPCLTLSLHFFLSSCRDVSTRMVFISSFFFLRLFHPSHKASHVLLLRARGSRSFGERRIILVLNTHTSSVTHPGTAHARTNTAQRLFGNEIYLFKTFTTIVSVLAREITVPSPTPPTMRTMGTVVGQNVTRYMTVGTLSTKHSTPHPLTCLQKN